MKKILLLSTAILAVTTAASAQITTKGELGFKADNTDASSTGATDTGNTKDDTHTEFSVTGELSSSYTNDSKAGFSWGASWDFDWTAKDGSAAVTASDSQIYIDTEFGKVTLGQGVSAGLINDAADSIFTTDSNTDLESEAIKFSDSYAGLSVAVAVDDGGSIESAFSYTIAGLTFSAAQYAGAGSDDKTDYVYGVSGDVAGLSFAFGANPNPDPGKPEAAYEFGYTFAGLGITVTGEDSQLGDIDLTYDLADGLEASVSYDARDGKGVFDSVGLTVSF